MKLTYFLLSKVSLLPDPPAPDMVFLVDAEALPWFSYQVLMTSHSGTLVGFTAMAEELRDPRERPPKSDTLTDLNAVTGVPSNTFSAVLAFSPHRVIRISQLESSRTVSSHLRSSFPVLLDVMEETGETLMTTPMISMIVSGSMLSISEI